MLDQKSDNGLRQIRRNGTPSRKFPSPVLCSELQAVGNENWLWRGLIARNSITLFSALWKSGKSTLLAHLLRAMGQGETFCGQPVAAGKALIVSEEPPALWARRRDDLGLCDHVQFLLRPFRVARPSLVEWQDFVGYLLGLVEDEGFDLVALDTLASLWPVADENNAAEVTNALLPLNELAERTAVLAIHHIRKSDGGQATASRGSGAWLPSFVETILELRRRSGEPSTKRVLTAYGRWPETPDDLVIELDLETKTYRALGGSEQDALEGIKAKLSDILPRKRPGFTFEEVREHWPSRFQKAGRVRKALEQSAGHLWVKDGGGRKNDPFRYWIQSST